MHKIIYTGQNAPSDKKTYLWKKKDENGNVALYEYNGTRWEKMAGGSGGGGMIETTYDDLVELRDSGSLSPGTWYRITDYETMTSQEGTYSAGHQFDIAVLALSGNELSEEAKALHHVMESSTEPEPEQGTGSDPVLKVSSNTGTLRTAGPPDAGGSSDTEEDYFSDCNLAAWKIWYCLDNDSSRFSWAVVPIPEYVIAAPTDNNKNQDRYYRDQQKDILSNGTEYHAWTSKNNVTIYQTDFDGDVKTYNWDEYESMQAYTPGPNQLTWYANYRITSYHEESNEYGKGVIYRMIDEHRNDCFYDFKNIKVGSNLKDSYYTFNFYRSGEGGPRDASVTVDENLGILASDNYIAPSHMHYDSSSRTWSMDKAIHITGCILSVNTGNTGNYLIHNVKIAEDCYVVRLSAGNLINLDICSGVHNTTSWTVNGDEDSVITIARGKTTDENKMYSITDNMTTFILPDLPH